MSHNLSIKGTPRVIPVPKNASPDSESDDGNEIDKPHITTIIKKRASSDSLSQTIAKTKSPEKPSSVRSSQNSQGVPDDDDGSEDNEYNRIFNKKKSNDQSLLNVSSSRPKTRRGLQNNFSEDNEQNGATQKPEPDTTDIWRPSSELDTNEPVDRLIGLEDLNDHTSRSNDQKLQSPPPSTTLHNDTGKSSKTGGFTNTDSEDDDD